MSMAMSRHSDGTSPFPHAAASSPGKERVYVEEAQLKSQSSLKVLNLSLEMLREHRSERAQLQVDALLHGNVVRSASWQHSARTRWRNRKPHRARVPAPEADRQAIGFDVVASAVTCWRGVECTD